MPQTSVLCDVHDVMRPAADLVLLSFGSAHREERGSPYPVVDIGDKLDRQVAGDRALLLCRCVAGADSLLFLLARVTEWDRLGRCAACGLTQSGLCTVVVCRTWLPP